MRGEHLNFNETLGFLASRGASGHCCVAESLLSAPSLNALIIRKRAFLPPRTALKWQQRQDAPNGFRAKKNVGVIFVFLCVFVCFCVCPTSRPTLPQAPLASRARLHLHVYGVTHAGGILTEAVEKEKPTGVKMTVFPGTPPQGENLSPRRLGRILTLLRRPRVYGPRLH